MNIIKQTKKTAADQARQIAKQVAREPLEMAKTVVPPHIIEGAKKESTSPITEAILQDQKKANEAGIDDFSEEEAQIKTNRRLRELEEEIKKIRQEREAQMQQWKKAQEEAMKEEKPAEQPFVMPQGKKRRGMLGPGQKKQGTQEMGKQKTG